MGNQIGMVANPESGGGGLRLLTGEIAPSRVRVEKDEGATFGNRTGVLNGNTKNNCLEKLGTWGIYSEWFNKVLLVKTFVELGRLQTKERTKWDDII